MIHKNLTTLLRGVDILEVHGPLAIPVKGLCYDSRRVTEGDLFVAIRGLHHDGTRFIGDAVRQGARTVVTEKMPDNGGAETVILVRDTRKALAVLAGNFFESPSRAMQLIGVTGTNGKTTTSLLLESVFKQAGHSVGVLGTLAYRWGETVVNASMTTPESLDLQEIFSRMRADHVSHVVMEVSSHALALDRVAGCAFRAGVFTNLSQDHLDFHADMESYFAAKALLFKRYQDAERQPAVAVINYDDPYGERLMRELTQEVWSYSTTRAAARVRVNSATLNAAGIEAELATPQGVLRLRSPLIGRLNLYNLLAAATTGLALGVPPEAVAMGLAAVSHVDGRLQRMVVPPGRGYEVVVDYAHTPDAMEKSLDCLRAMTRGRLLVVFGCGGDRDRAKRPIMGRVAAELGDLLFLTSDNPRNEVPEAIIDDIEAGVRAAGLNRLPEGQKGQGDKGFLRVVDRRRAIELALSYGRPGDVIFIGGKGHETYQIVGDRVLAFDDRSVVQNYFADLTQPD